MHIKINNQQHAAITCGLRLLREAVADGMPHAALPLEEIDSLIDEINGGSALLPEAEAAQILAARYKVANPALAVDSDAVISDDNVPNEQWISAWVLVTDEQTNEQRTWDFEFKCASCGHEWAETLAGLKQVPIVGELNGTCGMCGKDAAAETVTEVTTL